MFGSDCANNSQMSIIYNVRIDQRDALTNKLIKRVEGKNTVTKLALMGVIRLFNGEFDEGGIYETNNYVPHYIALGTNGRNQEGKIVNVKEPPALVGIWVDPNDTALHAELLDSDEKEERVKLTQTNVVENNLNTNYVKLRIKCFIPSESYNGVEQVDGSYSGTIIEEAGLFTKESGNNCWARYVMPTGTVIHKDQNSVIDITWEITVKSSSSAQYPSSIRCLLDTPDGSDMPVLNINMHKDSNGNYYDIPIDLYGLVQLEPQVITNMNTIYFNTNGKDDIFSISDRGIGKVLRIPTQSDGDIIVTATTVNNISTKFKVVITNDDE